MSYTVEGNTVKKDGKIIDRCGSHGDAVVAAQDRTKKSSRAAMKPTAGRMIFFEFGDAKQFVSVVDPKKAMAEDLAAVDDPEMVKVLMARDDSAVSSEHQKIVRAKSSELAFTDAGIHFPAGSWVVIDENGKSHSMTDADFQASYQPLKKSKNSKAAESVS